MKTHLLASTALSLLLPFFVTSEGKSSRLQIIEHSLEEIEYVPGRFPFEQKKDSLYTAPFRPAEAPIQCTKIYQEEPLKLLYEEGLEESVLMRISPEKDGRTKIDNTTQWPYLFHSQLGLYFADGKHGGSGTLVGPQHILTAAHNIYKNDTQEWAQTVVARLALNGKIIPFDECKASRIFTFGRWVNNKDLEYDMALIVLDRPIGLKTGWAGLLSLNDQALKQEEIHVTGYPGDKGLIEMWTMSHTIKQVSPERIYYEIDTYPGQSGSAVWLNKWGSPYVVGVHTHGEGVVGIGNSGTRFSLPKAAHVLKWIQNTLSINQKARKSLISAVSYMDEEEKPKDDTLDTINLWNDLAQKGNQNAFRNLERSANQGNLHAKYNLAKIYYLAKVVPQDYVKARQLLEEAEARGHQDGGMYNILGIIYSEGQGVAVNYFKANTYYEKARALGNAVASCNLGQNYYDGTGVPQDFTQARQLLEEAEARGYQDGEMYNTLGIIYDNGQGVAANRAKANVYYEKARALGNAAASRNLGQNYYHGTGVPQDFTQARQLLEEAEARGYQSGRMYNLLGIIYDEGQGGAVNLVKANACYQKARAQGYAAASYRLGQNYYYGTSIAQDFTQARQLLEEAEARGYQDGEMYNILGVIYGSGQKVAVDLIKATAYYQKARIQGNATASRNLGINYYHANGVPQDFIQSRQLLEEAEARGYQDGEMYNILGVIYGEGKGVFANRVKANAYYEKARALNGSAGASCNLGHNYYDGVGVPRDYIKARQFLEEAEARGYQSIRMYDALGAIYSEGKGVEVDKLKGKAYYEKAKNFKQ
jgi:TPR repeat protein